jgi:glycosyltransferase involved in cell wall biosynthesis
MNLLFVNTKGNWGGIVNLSAVLMRALFDKGVKSWFLCSKNRSKVLILPPPVQNIAMRTGFDYNPLTILKLVKIIKKHDIDYVVVNIAKEIIFGGIAARLCGKKCIRLIGNELDFDRHHLLNRTLVDMNIHPSQYTLNAAVKQFPYCSNMRNKVLYCGIEDRAVSEAEKQAEYARLAVSKDNLIIGCTGRIVEDKGVQTLVKAFAQIADALPQAVLVINGRGEYMPMLEKQVTALGIQHRVRLLGFAPDCLVAASIYDIAVMPSRFEGFPNTIIEYLSLAKPVISTAVGGIAEAITDGDNGMFFTVDDAEDLVQKIMLIAGSPPLMQSLSRNARATYLAHFTAPAMAAAFLGCIQELK